MQSRVEDEWEGREEGFYQEEKKANEKRQGFEVLLWIRIVKRLRSGLLVRVQMAVVSVQEEQTSVEWVYYTKGSSGYHYSLSRTLDCAKSLVVRRAAYRD